MHNYKTDGIIIKRINSGEADRVLTILTPFYGKLRVVAKGARKITSQRGPNLELFNQTAFVIHKGNRYEYVSEAKALNSFEYVRKDLGRIAQAYQLCELIHLLTRENQELEEIYEHLLVSFHRLNKRMSFNMNDFKHKLLFILGFASEKAPYELDEFIEEITQRRLLTKRIYE